MTDMNAIRVIRQKVDSNVALKHVESMSAGSPVVFERGVLYPYFAFKARCTVLTIVGRKKLSFNCVVDGINGHGATADAFDSESVRATDEMRLAAEVSEDAARQIARRAVTHRLSKRFRMIAPFDAQLRSADIVYKRFWIIRVDGFRFMVDSVTGSTCPVSAAAA